MSSAPCLFSVPSSPSPLHTPSPVSYTFPPHPVGTIIGRYLDSPFHWALLQQFSAPIGAVDLLNTHWANVTDPPLTLFRLMYAECIRLGEGAAYPSQVQRCYDMYGNHCWSCITALTLSRILSSDY